MRSIEEVVSSLQEQNIKVRPIFLPYEYGRTINVDPEEEAALIRLSKQLKEVVKKFN